MSDPSGNIVLKETPDSEYRNGPGRVTRTANLDGTSTINHGGVQDGDRTFRISSNLTKAESDAIWYIHKNSTLLTICAPDGAYIGAIDYIDVNGGNLNLTLLIKERASS